jgi:hypothetical protein
MAAAVVEAVTPATTQMSYQVSDWLYEFKTASLRSEDPPDDLPFFLEVVGDYLSKNLQDVGDPLTAKLKFNLSEDTSEHITRYGIDLWRVRDPVLERNWLSFDLCLIMNQLHLYLNSTEDLSALPYARLAIGIAKTLSERSFRFPQGETIIPDGEKVKFDWPTFFDLPDGHIGAVAAFFALTFIEAAMFGLSKLQIAIDGSVSALQENVLRAGLRAAPKGSPFPAFFEDYRRNRRRIFER